MNDYSRRLRARELMDEPETPVEDLRGALRELEKINKELGGHKASLEGVRALLPAGAQSFSLLDVGCGAGDFARTLAARVNEQCIRSEILGIDLSPVTIEHARELTREQALGNGSLRFEARDLFELEGEGRFDIVHASLVLHHFDGDDAPRALEAMMRLARVGVVINDLHRHPVAYWSFRAISRWRWPNRLIQHDGPISVLRGFRRADFEAYAARLGGCDCEVHWRWAFRWLVLLRKKPAG